MEINRISIYEALPLLREVLNVSGFFKLIGKSGSWFNNKEGMKQAYDTIPMGFTQDNIELINYGLEKVVEACHKHKLKLPSECPDRDIYNKYVKTELRDLRKLVSLVYIRENYTQIPVSSWNKKLINTPNRGTVAQFTSEDIKHINQGIDKVAELLASMNITL